MNIHYTVASSNSKTGPMLVTTQSEDTCPPSCPYHEAGCYARYGPLAWHWNRVSVGERVKVWQDFLAAVRSLPKRSPWRLSQAGDLPGKGNRIDQAKLREIVEANRNRRGFTFTHKRLTKANRKAIKEANEQGFTINLSTDSPAEADQKAALKIGPVVMVMPEDPSLWPSATPGGIPIIPCLAVTKGLQCTTCLVCSVATRKSIVGFPAHGTAKRKVEGILAKLQTIPVVVTGQSK